jgi:hypothetical protein
VAPWCFSAWPEYCALCRSMLRYIIALMYNTVPVAVGETMGAVKRRRSI